MMSRRRRMMIAAVTKSKKLWLYKNGTTGDGYAFAAAGYYGASASASSSSSSYGFSNANGILKCSAYDGSATYAYGCAMVETTGLSRTLLSKYKSICFTATCSPNASSYVQYQHVGVYSSKTPTSGNRLAGATPTYDAYGKVTIDIASLLSANPTVSTFYIGAGVLSVASMAYGAMYVSVKEIWLE